MKLLRRVFLPLIAIVCSFSSQAVFAQGIQSRYRKIEYRIPMRDGIKLYTAIYIPTMVAGKHPILMERTPYGAGPYGADTFKRNFRGSPKLQEAGYIFAFQDVRGKEQSEGDYVNIRPQLKTGEKGIDESTDTYDTIDFLVKNVPDNNGKVGLWGISYPGFYAAAGAINSHPNLAAVSPQAPVTNWFFGDDVHHNGAFFLQDNLDFSLFFDVPRPKTADAKPDYPVVDREGLSAYDFYLKVGALPNIESRFLMGKIPYWRDELMEHGTYDQYWKDRATETKMLNVRCAVLTVGGLFDAEDMWGAWNLYKYTEKQNKGIYNALVMGPWYHGMWASKRGSNFGDIDFGSNTATYYEDSIEFPFFEHFLRDQKDVNPPAEATIFETGNNRWRTFTQWPPANLAAFNLYLSDTGNLKSDKPKTSGSEEYVYDPAHPTPYTSAIDSKRRPAKYMIDDQRFFTARKDVVTYQTEPLTADTTVAGKIDAELFASTTGTDADFVVKVIDVYPTDTTDKTPGGESLADYQMLVRGDIFRGKFRDSFEKPKPFVPGQPTRVAFALNDLLHTFRKGHRIMVQVQSAWFPLVDRNPNRFIDIYHAKDSDFQTANIRLYHSPKYPSAIHFHRLTEQSVSVVPSQKSDTR